ncbi:hypothetical protein FE783_36940 [Paenibacillus mesophilus]|uniref:hypothetical protein n=1 Tax=Paenibacillus mesophilus TaxID=2582849 RepID=UPI00110EF697|nr:hypothetical protein [Paenibacillus mesophilus]TMV42745.1 hypothetical protein FE783_36940 [Paenibacillus mesophilus]
MNTHSFARTRVIRLRRGQSVALVCGFTLVTRRITLRPGQFVVATCDGSPRTIIVGCRSFRREIRIRLRIGERLIIRCHS